MTSEIEDRVEFAEDNELILGHLRDRRASERERRASCLHDACCLLAAAAILKGFIRPQNSGEEEEGEGGGTVKHDAVCWAAAAAESKGGRLTHSLTSFLHLFLLPPPPS